MDPKIYVEMRELEDHHWWFTARRKIVSKVLHGLRLSRVSRILDMGCGTGGNLPLLTTFGHVTGVELDDAAAAMARERAAGPVLKGALPDSLPFGSDRFDAILLLDVLEHIEDDLASLKRLHSMLSPGGHLVLTVPAFRFLWSAHDTTHHHHRRYTATQLRTLLVDAGYDVSHLTYFNTLLFPVVAAVRLGGKLLRRRPTAHDLTMPAPTTNRLLAWIFGSERYVIDRIRLPFGVSLLAVARREAS